MTNNLTSSQVAYPAGPPTSGGRPAAEGQRTEKGRWLEDREGDEESRSCSTLTCESERPSDANSMELMGGDPRARRIEGPVGDSATDRGSVRLFDHLAGKGSTDQEPLREGGASASGLQPLRNARGLDVTNLDDEGEESATSKRPLRRNMEVNETPTRIKRAPAVRELKRPQPGRMSVVAQPPIRQRQAPQAKAPLPPPQTLPQLPYSNESFFECARIMAIGLAQEAQKTQKIQKTETAPAPNRGCGLCGVDYRHRRGDTCKAIGQKCRNCLHVGHLQGCCPFEWTIRTLSTPKPQEPGEVRRIRKRGPRKSQLRRDH
jgi:hypothetical protein